MLWQWYTDLLPSILHAPCRGESSDDSREYTGIILGTSQIDEGEVARKYPGKWEGCNKMHYWQIIVSDQYGTVRKCIQYMWYITVDHEQTVVSADWIWQDISGPYFLAVLWIWIRIGSVFRGFLDPDPHMQIYFKIEAKDVRFKIFINNSET